MYTTHQAQPPSHVTKSLQRNKLGTLAIACFVLSAAAPVTVVAGVIPTGFATTGIIGMPLAFFVIGAVLGLFCVGFNAMTRRISNAGPFYAYVSQGLGKPLGLACFLIAALAYNMLQVGLYGIFGVAVGPLLNPVFGTNLPWWVWALGACAVVAVLGVRRVDLNGRILLILMGLEIILVLIFDAANILNPATPTPSFVAFDPNALFVAGVGAMFVVAITSFVGFEASAIFSEEARDPARTVPRATYLCLGVIAVLYGLSAWSMTVTTGPDRIAEFAGQNGGETLFVLAGTNLGGAWPTIGHVLFATSVFAAMVSYHNAVGRYMFSVGRENVLPGVFGQANDAGAPRWGSIFQSAVGLIVIIVYALGNLDPLVQLFFWGGTSGGFGVLLLLTVTSAAVIGYHVRNGSETLLRGVIAPGIAFVLLLAILALAFANFDSLLGVPETSSLRWTLPGAFLIVAVIGVIWAVILKTRWPNTYRAIGLGANSATGRSTSLDDRTGAHEVEDGLR